MNTQQYATSPEHASRPPDYRRYWLALLRRDVAQAEALLDQAVATLGPPRVYLRFFAPALRLSGTKWAAGEISHVDEHFITFHTLRLMRRVRRAFVVRHPTGPVALAAGVASDGHRLGLRMVCDFLQADNWRIHWLWEKDRASLRAAIDARQPKLILFSIGMPEGIEPARRLIDETRRRGFAGMIAVGGRTIDDDPSLVNSLGANVTAKHGLQLVRRLRRIAANERG